MNLTVKHKGAMKHAENNNKYTNTKFIYDICMYTYTRMIARVKQFRSTFKYIEIYPRIYVCTCTYINSETFINLHLCIHTMHNSSSAFKYTASSAQVYYLGL